MDDNLKGPPLNELVNPELKVTLRGQEYRVHPMDGYGYDLIKRVQKENDVPLMYSLAARCLMPQMTRDEVFGTEETIGLTADEVAKVIQAASDQAEKIEALASPNSAPAGKRGSQLAKAS
jgi:hypothetical protein